MENILLPLNSTAIASENNEAWSLFYSKCTEQYFHNNLNEYT